MLARGDDFGARGEAREVRRGRCLEELEDEAMCDSLHLNTAVVFARQSTCAVINC